MPANPFAEFYTLALLVGTVVACGWAFYRTRLPATLAYAVYALVARFSLYPSQNFTRAIIEGKAGQNLGATVTERMATYTTLSSIGFYTLQAIFVIWLIVSLARAAQDKSGGSAAGQAREQR